MRFTSVPKASHIDRSRPYDPRADAVPVGPEWTLVRPYRLVREEQRQSHSCRLPVAFRSCRAVSALTRREPVSFRRGKAVMFNPWCRGESAPRCAAVHSAVPWTRARRVGTPGPSSWSRGGVRPTMLITRARVDPVTSGPVPVSNGLSSARNSRPATAVWLATAKLRRAKNSATGVSASAVVCLHRRQRSPRSSLINKLRWFISSFRHKGRRPSRGTNHRLPQSDFRRTNGSPNSAPDPVEPHSLIQRPGLSHRLP